MKRLLRLALLTLLFLAACGSTLPEKRPSDFALNYSDGGGMMPYGTGFHLNGSSASVDVFNEGVTINVMYELTTSELDVLYQAVVDNQFDRIRTYEQQVYDRGGTSVSVTADGETVNVSNGGMSFIRAGWEEEYGNVLTAIGQVSQREPGPTTAEFLITWGDSFSMSGTTLTINLGGDFVSLISDMGSNEARIVTNNPNGRYEVTAGNYSTTETSTVTLDLTTNLAYQLVQEEGTPTIKPAP